MSAKKLKTMPECPLTSKTVATKVDPLKLMMGSKRSALIKGRDAMRACDSCHKVSLSSLKVCPHCGGKFSGK